MNDRVAIEPPAGSQGDYGPAEPTPMEHADSPEHHSVYCPTCSSRLLSRRCKLICVNCGYYLSCADYY